MKVFDICGNPVRQFIISVCIHLVGLGLFFFCMLANAYVAQYMLNIVDLDRFRGVVFGINLLTYIIYMNIYMISIYMVYFRLRNVNEFMKKIENARENANEKEFREMLNTIAIIVDKICDVLDSIKICYTVNSLTFISYATFFFVLGIYGNFSYFFRVNPDEMELFFSLLTLFWNMFYFPFLMTIIFISNWIKHEGKKIESQIQQFSLNFLNFDVKSHKKTQLILMQLSHRRPIVSCGVFNIDWYLLFGCIATGFAYLVIIIQFELKTF